PRCRRARCGGSFWTWHCSLKVKPLGGFCFERRRIITPRGEARLGWLFLSRTKNPGAFIIPYSLRKLARTTKLPRGRLLVLAYQGMVAMKVKHLAHLALAGALVFGTGAAGAENQNQKGNTAQVRPGGGANVSAGGGAHLHSQPQGGGGINRGNSARIQNQN